MRWPPEPPIDPSPSGGVSQGPEWLRDLFFSPPPWVNPVLQAAAVVTVAVVAYRLYRWDWEIPLDVQREMQIIVAHFTAMVSGTLAMVNWLSYPYLVDVGVGVWGGYGLVLVLQWGPVRRRLPGPTDARERVVVGWVLLAVCLVVGPALAASRGIGVKLTTSRWLLVGLATVMVAYNAGIIEGEWQPGAE